MERYKHDHFDFGHFNSFCTKMLFQVVVSSICQFVSSFATTLSRVQYSKKELIIVVDIVITASLIVNFVLVVAYDLGLAQTLAHGREK